jgi:ribosomal protein S18 acetylase RimI-like enzyme
MEIRIASKNDSENIGRLHADSWRTAYNNVLSEEYLSGNIISERVTFWHNRLESPAADLRVVVAAEGDQIVGFACFVIEHDTQWGSLLDNLHVAPMLKRSRIGTLLMAEVARICNEQAGHKGLYLWVLEANENAQRFYKALGARHTDSDTWFPPGGGQVPKFRYAWSSVQDLKCAGGF